MSSSARSATAIACARLAHAESPKAPGRGCYWDEHVVLAPDGSEQPEPTWEWAELDGARLVFAKEGALHASSFDQTGTLAPSKLLHDFSQMSFAQIVPPHT